MYTKTTWVNDSVPAINADNLNNIETGIDGLYTWVNKTNADDATSLTAYEFAFCDTTTAAFTLNLPTTPTFGDQVKVVDVAGNFNTNALTLGQGGELIMGLAEDLIVNVQYEALTLTFSGATHGWIITSKN